MGSSDRWELHSTPVRAKHPHKLFGILLHKEICLLLYYSPILSNLIFSEEQHTGESGLKLFKLKVRAKIA